jgi:hypothetical protein
MEYNNIKKTTSKLDIKLDFTILRFHRITSKNNTFQKLTPYGIGFHYRIGTI